LRRVNSWLMSPPVPARRGWYHPLFAESHEKLALHQCTIRCASRLVIGEQI
jgi:hypothetical protein